MKKDSLLIFGLQRLASLQAAGDGYWVTGD